MGNVCFRDAGWTSEQEPNTDTLHDPFISRTSAEFGNVQGSDQAPVDNPASATSQATPPSAAPHPIPLLSAIRHMPPPRRSGEHRVVGHSWLVLEAPFTSHDLQCTVSVPPINTRHRATKLTVVSGHVHWLQQHPTSPVPGFEPGITSQATDVLTEAVVYLVPAARLGPWQSFRLTSSQPVLPSQVLSRSSPCTSPPCELSAATPATPPSEAWLTTSSSSATHPSFLLTAPPPQQPPPTVTSNTLLSPTPAAACPAARMAAALLLARAAPHPSLVRSLLLSLGGCSLTALPPGPLTLPSRGTPHCPPAPVPCATPTTATVRVVERPGPASNTHDATRMSTECEGQAHPSTTDTPGLPLGSQPAATELPCDLPQLEAPRLAQATSNDRPVALTPPCMPAATPLPLPPSAVPPDQPPGTTRDLPPAVPTALQAPPLPPTSPHGPPSALVQLPPQQLGAEDPRPGPLTAACKPAFSAPPHCTPPPALPTPCYGNQSTLNPSEGLSRDHGVKAMEVAAGPAAAAHPPPDPSYQTPAASSSACPGLGPAPGPRPYHTSDDGQREGRSSWMLGSVQGAPLGQAAMEPPATDLTTLLPRPQPTQLPDSLGGGSVEGAPWEVSLLAWRNSLAASSHATDRGSAARTSHTSHTQGLGGPGRGPGLLSIMLGSQQGQVKQAGLARGLQGGGGVDDSGEEEEASQPSPQQVPQRQVQAPTLPTPQLPTPQLPTPQASPLLPAHYSLGGLAEGLMEGQGQGPMPVSDRRLLPGARPPALTAQVPLTASSVAAEPERPQGSRAPRAPSSPRLASGPAAAAEAAGQQPRASPAPGVPTLLAAQQQQQQQQHVPLGDDQVEVQVQEPGPGPGEYGGQGCVLVQEHVRGWALSVLFSQVAVNDLNPGVPLLLQLQGGATSYLPALQVLLRVAELLAHLHGLGLSHGDLNAGSVVLEPLTPLPLNVFNVHTARHSSRCQPAEASSCNPADWQQPSSSPAAAQPALAQPTDTVGMQTLNRPSLPLLPNLSGLGHQAAGSSTSALPAAPNSRSCTNAGQAAKGSCAARAQSLPGALGARSRHQPGAGTLPQPCHSQAAQAPTPSASSGTSVPASRLRTTDLGKAQVAGSQAGRPPFHPAPVPEALAAQPIATAVGPVVVRVRWLALPWVTPAVDQAVLHAALSTASQTSASACLFSNWTSSGSSQITFITAPGLEWPREQPRLTAPQVGRPGREDGHRWRSHGNLPAQPFPAQLATTRRPAPTSSSSRLDQPQRQRPNNRAPDNRAPPSVGRDNSYQLAAALSVGKPPSSASTSRQSGRSGTPGSGEERTPAWPGAHVAPELFSGGAPTPAADMYALGILMWEVYHGKRAFQHLPATSLQHVRSGQLRPIFTAHCARGYQQLAQQCMLHNPDARPTASQVVTILSQLLLECAAWPVPQPDTLTLDSFDKIFM
ncbi:hypothetical protein V8C86DRAFT_2777067 [Haematococcus lacustris]